MLIEKCKQIEERIFRIKSSNPDIEPISDGIIDIEKYLLSRFKILWILKESNDVVNGSGGGWSLNDAINKGTCWAEQKRTGKKTFERMIYVSYSILNQFPLWDEIPNISTNHHVWETIKSIAYINVKKIPGVSTAYEPDIRNAYKEQRELLLDQINTYSPDIIICGNTLNYFLNDLDLTDPKYYGCLKYYEKGERLYINAYHPNVRPITISEKEYCNEIITIAKDWAFRFRK